MKYKKHFRKAFAIVLCICVALCSNRITARATEQLTDVLIDDFRLPNTSNARTGFGCKWTSNTIDVYVNFNTVDLGNNYDSAMSAIEDALDMWSTVSYGGYSINFNFNIVETHIDTGIVITFGAASGERLAHTELINTSNESSDTYDSDQDGEVDWLHGNLKKAIITCSTNSVNSFSFGSPQAEKYDFQTIIAHELGHALGIAHCHEKSESACSSTCVNNLMHPTVSTGVRKSLQTYDKASLVAIYYFFDT